MATRCPVVSQDIDKTKKSINRFIKDVSAVIRYEEISDVLAVEETGFHREPWYPRGIAIDLITGNIYVADGLIQSVSIFSDMDEYLNKFTYRRMV